MVTVVERGWNLWVWLVGMVSRRRVWNLLVWLECIGVVSGCCCTPLVLTLFCSSIPTSLLIFKMFFSLHFCLIE